MDWEWSHTAEGISAAYDNLHLLPHAELVTIYAEWNACPDPEALRPDFRTGRYYRARKAARSLPADTLADSIWEQAEALRTCDDGGFHAHVCPYGCHLVSFDPVKTASGV